jgi:hypothetical protein
VNFFIVIILLQLGVQPMAEDLALGSRTYTDKEIRLYINGTIFCTEIDHRHSYTLCL